MSRVFSPRTGARLGSTGAIAAFLTTVSTAAVPAVAIFAFSSGPVQARSTSCLPASLRSTLSQIRARFGPVGVLSTHRPGARIAGTGRPSYHASCRAVDFRAPSGRRAAVIAWLRANHAGGLGVYTCGMSHIHIDNGPPVRWSKCVGNPRSARR
jgi:uncharacterized protein YcbK (DUF882 family)